VIEHHGSEGHAFGGGEGGVFEQTVPVQHRVNELFCFEPKDNQVEAIQHLLCDRNQILYLPSSPPIHHPGRVEASELNHYVLEEEHLEQAEKLKWMAGALNSNTSTRKNRREICAGVYYTHSKHS
jgi:hypothetical protein